MATLSPAETLTAPMTPVPHRVAWRRAETADTVTLALEPVTGERLRFSAGQFNMLYAFAVGEVPVSISGSPLEAGPLLHTVRAVGAVSRALCDLDTGDVVGVRGPFGTGWNVPAAEGRDLVVIAGGIGLAPLRSVVTQVIGRRARFGDVQVVVGARTPEDICFRDDVEAWRAEGVVDVHVTVDRGGWGWRGTVGVVTRVLPRLPLSAGATAMICGPEVMMRLCAAALLDRGLHPARVRLSMERNMQCGIGQCGHCQLGPAFVCTDGPVFTWERLERLLAVPEL